MLVRLVVIAVHLAACGRFGFFEVPGKDAAAGLSSDGDGALDDGAMDDGAMDDGATSSDATDSSMATAGDAMTDAPPSSCSAATCPWGCVGMVCNRAIQLSASSSHACAVRAMGQVVCWGWNNKGEVGDGTMIERHAPVAVLNITDAIKVATGELHSCALRANGAVACWGYNNAGQLGDGSQSDSAMPVAVGGLTDAIDIAAGESSTCAVRSGGSVVCWGSSITSESGPCSASGFNATIKLVPTTITGVTNAQRVSLRHRHACAKIGDGTARCWWSNACTQLGDGTAVLRTAAVAVLTLTNTVDVLAAVDHSCAARSGGEIVCWGFNNSGQLGDATTTNSPSPITASEFPNATQVAGGIQHTCALRGGVVTCRGADGFGQLGNGGGPSVIGDVMGLTDATFVAAGDYAGYAIRATGDVVAWGANGAGQLGDGSTNPRQAPSTVTPPP